MTANDPNLFERYDPPEMVDKLRRELFRFREASTSSRDIQLDHMMNFIWTASHLRERAWIGIEKLEPMDRNKLETKLKTSWTCWTDFRNWVNTNCPEHEACRQLANIAKHNETSMWDSATAVADVTARPADLASDPNLVEVLKAESWTFEIDHGAGHEHVDPMFQRIVSFWNRVMGYGLGINW